MIVVSRSLTCYGHTGCRSACSRLHGLRVLCPTARLEYTQPHFNSLLSDGTPSISSRTSALHSPVALNKGDAPLKAGEYLRKTRFLARKFRYVRRSRVPYFGTIPSHGRDACSSLLCALEEPRDHHRGYADLGGDRTKRLAAIARVGQILAKSRQSGRTSLRFKSPEKRARTFYIMKHDNRDVESLVESISARISIQEMHKSQRFTPLRSPATPSYWSVSRCPGSGPPSAVAHFIACIGAHDTRTGEQRGPAL